MKNIIKHLGIIALAAVIGLSMASCDTGGGGGGRDAGGPARFGEARTVTNQQVRHFNAQGQLVNFTGALEIEQWGIDVEGAVTGGLLSFAIGTPGSLRSIYSFIEDELEWYGWSNVSSNNPSVYSFVLDEVHTTPDGFLARRGGTGTANYRVYYIWVSHDVTITGTGGPRTCTCGYCDCIYWDGVCWCVSTAGNLNLVLEAGWNAITWRFSAAALTLTVANPGHVGWIWWDYYYD